jgi:hypothetical protein
MAETVTAHLSERFSAHPKLMKDAGDQMRRIGERYGELRMEDKKRRPTRSSSAITRPTTPPASS